MGDKVTSQGPTNIQPAEAIQYDSEDLQVARAVGGSTDIQISTDEQKSGLQNQTSNT